MSYTSAFPQALIISSAVSSLVTLHLWRKKCLGEKSAWEPDSQDPAYYAGLGADVEVGNETQPGVIALHSVSGKAEEEGDGDHHQEALF